MLPAAAGIPPHVAQVPIAIVAAARGASAMTQSVTFTGPLPRLREVRSWDVPIVAKAPALSAWSSGSDPSTTTMYGAPSEPLAAAVYIAIRSCPDSSDSIG